MNLLKSNDDLWAVLLSTEQIVDALWGGSSVAWFILH